MSIHTVTDVPLFSVGGELISCVVTNLITENTVVRYSDTTFSLFTVVVQYLKKQL